jgi:hypothetical protein
MGWLVVTKWDRRDTASREELGLAALQLCRAQRARGHVTSSRFYWVTPDEVAIVDETEDRAGYFSPAGEELGAALFAMADLASLSFNEQWADAATGEAGYRAAGR